MSESAAAQIVAEINAKDPAQPAILENGHPSGVPVGEEAANRLAVRGYGCNASGEQVVAVDLAAGQIFARTSYAG